MSQAGKTWTSTDSIPGVDQAALELTDRKLPRVRILFAPRARFLGMGAIHG